MNVNIKEPQQQAQACIIWLHGLGADSNDMRGLAQQLVLEFPVKHIFMDAPVRPVTINNRMPMQAWYDIVGVQLTDREDKEGIFDSEEKINAMIAQQIHEGFEAQQIFLAGFSQGGAMALFTGLRHNLALGGIIALSAYLPLISECQSILSKTMPIFVASGRFDPIVLPIWTRQTFDWLKGQKFAPLTWKDYPMEHNVCAQEMRDLADWVTAHCSLTETRNGVAE